MPARLLQAADELMCPPMCFPRDFVLRCCLVCTAPSWSAVYAVRNSKSAANTAESEISEAGIGLSSLEFGFFLKAV